MLSVQVQQQDVIYGPEVAIDNILPITELHYVGWAKIKTNETQTDVITHQ